MDRLPESLVEELEKGPVKRTRITAVMSIERGVAALLKSEAKVRGKVVLRFDKGKQYEVAYQLRSVEADENPGDLIEMH